MDLIASGIKDYLFSRNTVVKSILQELDDNEKVSYGLSVYDEIRSYLEYIILQNEDRFADYRVFHYLYAHKQIMNLRIRYLLDNGYISEKDYENINYDTIERECLDLRNGIIRYDFVKKKDLLFDAIKLTKEIKKNEEDALFKILYSIRGNK